MTQTVNICLLSGDANQDRLMHCMGLFEPSKRLATPNYFSASFLDDMPISFVINKLKEGAESSGKVVTAIIVLESLKDSYIDRSVVFISNGTHWTTMENFLGKNNLKVGDLCQTVH